MKYRQLLLTAYGQLNALLQLKELPTSEHKQAAIETLDMVVATIQAARQRLLDET